MSKEYDIIINCATWAMNKMAELSDYSWDGEFCKSEAKKAMDTIRLKLKEISFENITLEEAKKVRFSLWTDTTILCPLYAHPILKPDADNDVRFGCIADGWEVKNGKILWDNKKDLFSDEKDMESLTGGPE